MPPSPNCSESRYVAPWSVLQLIILIRSYSLGRACLETHLAENVCYGTCFIFTWMQSYDKTNFPRLFNLPLLTKCTSQSCLDGQGRQRTEKPRFARFTHSWVSGRPSVVSFIFHSPLSSLIGLVPHTHTCPTSDWFPGLPRKQTFCKKTPLIFKTLGQGMALRALLVLGQSSTAGFWVCFVHFLFFLWLFERKTRISQNLLYSQGCP